MSHAFRRPDATGRSSSAPMPREKKLTGIPAPFIAIPAEVVRSDAFRTLNIHARRVLDALLIENMAHRLSENGRLVVTYDQLEKDYGISRRMIAPAISNLEQRGLIQRTAIGCGNRRTGERAPSKYRITFLGALPDRLGPTDEWRRYRAAKPDRRADHPVPPSDSQGGHLVAPLRVAPGGTPRG